MADPRRLKRMKFASKTPTPSNPLKPGIWFVGATEAQFKIWSRQQLFAKFHLQITPAIPAVSKDDIVVINNNVSSIPEWAKGAQTKVDAKWFEQCLLKKKLIDMAPFLLPRDVRVPTSSEETSPTVAMEKGLSNLDQSIQIGRCDYSTATSHKRAPALGDCCLASWAFAEALRDAIFLAGNSDGRSGLKAKPRLAALTEDRVSWVLHAEEFWPSKEAFEEQWARCPKALDMTA